MQSCSKSKCSSASHQFLLENAKNRLNDIQERFANLQAARKEGRTNDVAMLEDQVYQMLREWNSELSAPSPASSLLVGSLGSFSNDIERLLQLCDEQDDATSPFAGLAETKPQVDVQGPHPGAMMTFQEDYLVNNELQEDCFQGFDKCEDSASDLHNPALGISQLTTQLDYYRFGQEFEHVLLDGVSATEECKKDTGPNILPIIHPPPSAFMGPKCALWDCTRPALGSELCKDYCSDFHATLACNEDFPGMAPVLRPGGINLKDSLLFNAVNAKAQGKNVGIPQCEGAATAKSPWNATELFDLSLLKGETIREWLFFDKHRKAFESGTRKQRSLPDHSGRGWHESRKRVMKEVGGQKRSYYMDPQPSDGFEWHLYEYEINGFDAYTLYRLEVKLASEKKTPKGKVTTDSLADLQRKMGQLTADVPADNKSPFKGQIATNETVVPANVNSSQNEMNSTTEIQHYCSRSAYKHLADNSAD